LTCDPFFCVQMTNDQAPITNTAIHHWSLGFGHWSFFYHAPRGPCSFFFFFSSFSRFLRSSAFSLLVSRLPVSPLIFAIWPPGLNMPLFCSSCRACIRWPIPF